MKNIKFTVTLIMAFVLSFTTVSAQSTEIRNLSGFTEVDFKALGQFNIRIGSEFKVAIEGDKELLAEIKTKVSNGKLSIIDKNRRRANNNTSDSKRITVDITMPAISGIAISGVGTAEVFDSFKAESLKLKANGVSKIILNDVSGEYINCKIKGVSHITIQGNGSFDRADMNIGGVSIYTGDYLKIGTANVKVSGVGKCNVYVSDDLKINASGLGSIIYDGSPKTNVGEIRKKY